MRKYFIIISLFLTCLIIYTYVNDNDVFILESTSLRKNSKKNIYNEINEKRNNNVFIDLGANKGDSILNFVGLSEKAQGGNFPKEFQNLKWIIYAFEANKHFDKQLIEAKQKIELILKHEINLFTQTAAWTYDGQIDFYLDTVNKEADFWGSSLNKNHVI
jgi:hypothetical protein